MLPKTKHVMHTITQKDWKKWNRVEIKKYHSLYLHKSQTLFCNFRNVSLLPKVSLKKILRILRNTNSNFIFLLCFHSLFFWCSLFTVLWMKSKRVTYSTNQWYFLLLRSFCRLLFLFSQGILSHFLYFNLLILFLSVNDVNSIRNLELI